MFCKGPVPHSSNYNGLYLMHQSKIFQGYRASYYGTFGQFILQAMGRKYPPYQSYIFFISTCRLANCSLIFPLLKNFAKTGKQISICQSSKFPPHYSLRLYLGSTCGPHPIHYKGQLDHSFFLVHSKDHQLIIIGCASPIAYIIHQILKLSDPYNIKFYIS